jgi:hypothetical protein
MSEQATVQGNIGRSAKTNLSDERIDPYQLSVADAEEVSGEEAFVSNRGIR